MKCAAASGLMLAQGTMAQSGGSGVTTRGAGVGTTSTGSATGAGQVLTTGDPRRDTMRRMMQPVTVSFKETRLEEVMAFVQTASQADLEVLWVDDRESNGLDKDASITLDAKNITLLQLVERILERADGAMASGSTSTWQMTPSGAMQIGTRDRLNKFKRVEIYDIADLTLEVPSYTDAPTLDLQQALQATGQGGGGGGQSPFRDGGTENQEPGRTLEERAEEVGALIRELVEPEQWRDNGGESTMRYFQRTLVVNAPDYVHRGVNGYPWWPSSSTTVAMAGTRRYVTLTTDVGTSKIEGFDNVPVTGVVPGTGAGGPPGGGG